MATIKKRNNKYCVIYNYITPDGQKNRNGKLLIQKKKRKKGKMR